MTRSALVAQPAHGFPRVITIFGTRLSTFRVFLFAGLYVGIAAVILLARSRNLPPLSVAVACLMCVTAGLIGSTTYFATLVGRAAFRSRAVLSTDRGGASLFGSVLPFTAASLVSSWMLAVPFAQFWDLLASGIIAGAILVRAGCVLNGCCGGRATAGRLGICLHDVEGRKLRRIPVQFAEIGGWTVIGAAFLIMWPWRLPNGVYALGMLAGYGFVRFWIEPWREISHTVAGVRVNRVIALILFVGCASRLATLV